MSVPRAGSMAVAGPTSSETPLIDGASGTVAQLLTGQSLASLLAHLPAYLQQQRWYGSKSSRVAGVRLHAAHPLADSFLCQFAVSFAQRAEEEIYQLPLALATNEQVQALPAGAVIARCSDGLLVVDAMHLAEFRSSLLTAITHHQPPPALEAHCTTAASGLAFTASRVNAVEQSNTSIFYDHAAVLKLYRRLQPGENPDIELPRFLAENTAFRHTPAYLGELREPATASTLCFLQAFAPNQGAAWAWFTSAIEPWLLRGDVAALQATTAAAQLIGTRTAEMHMALAMPASQPAFTAERYTPALLAADAARMQAQIAGSLDTLGQRFTALPAEPQAEAARVLARRADLTGFSHQLATGASARFGDRIRVHGDYHLGQLLRTGDDFLIVDFEGEPARALAARRAKDSPLRDVAGMLRSFAYVAEATLRTHAGQRLDQALQQRADGWAATATRAFQSAYFDAMGDHSALLPHAAERDTLLRCFTLEKALYELLYELNNRPTWVSIPLGGILAQLEPHAPAAESSGYTV